MDRSDVEAIESAWRVLSQLPSEAAQTATRALVAVLDELDDDGVMDELNKHRSAKDIIADIATSFTRRRSAV